MLHYYAFSNFQSFHERTEVSFELNTKASVRGWSVLSTTGGRYTTALGVLGANGAGKTALLKPLAFIDWFFRWSFEAKPDRPIPVMPHFSAPDEPTQIELEAEDRDGNVWRYAVALTRERVLFEALYKKKERFAYVFIREWDAVTKEYTIKQQNFNFVPSEAKKVRPNASMIATAAQYGVETAHQILDLHFVSNVGISGRHHMHSRHLETAALHYAKNRKHHAQMVQLLKKWDLGLDDVALEETEVVSIDSSGESKTRKRWTAKGVHRKRNGELVSLPFERESSGTQSAYILLASLLEILDEGGVAAIDEMESDLHPLMLEPILELFASVITNPHNAQFIFTCHSAEVLDLLQKSQVMFVEKNQCESSAYRADTIEGLRSDDNLRAKYMAGALGAIPRL